MIEILHVTFDSIYTWFQFFLKLCTPSIEFTLPSIAYFDDPKKVSQMSCKSL
jgi:hypothetical protein